MIKIDRYLKFSITVLDSDLMAFLTELVNDAAELLRRVEKPDYIYDNVLDVCSPGTYVHAVEGQIGYGIADYE